MSHIHPSITLHTVFDHFLQAHLAPGSTPRKSPTRALQPKLSSYVPPQHFSRWGTLAVRTLGVPRGTFLSSQIQVHAAFLASALLHCLGDVTLGHSVRYFGRVSLAFFLVNAVGITFEDSVVALARRAGVRGPPTRATRALGYVWVCAWFTWAARFYQEPIYAAGLGQARTLPWSPTMEVLVPFV